MRTIIRFDNATARANARRHPWSNLDVCWRVRTGYGLEWQSYCSRAELVADLLRTYRRTLPLVLAEGGPREVVTYTVSFA